LLLRLLLRLLRPLLRLLLLLRQLRLWLLMSLLLVLLLPGLLVLALRRMPIAVCQACRRLLLRQGLAVCCIVASISRPRYAAFAARGERDSRCPERRSCATDAQARSAQHSSPHAGSLNIEVELENFRA
jgi:hypothetical protein